MAIDIGHSRAKPGAVSARGGVEFDFNLNLGRLFLAELKNRGYEKAFIINPDGGPIGLTRRTKIAQQRGAELFISIHHDSVQPRFLKTWNWEGKVLRFSDKYRGFSLFVSSSHPSSSLSFEFAALLGQILLNSGFSPTLHHAEAIEGENRTLLDSAKGIYRFDELAVLKSSAMPAVLLECGVLVNRDEESLLANPVYQKAMARALADAADAFRPRSKKSM